MKGTAYEGPNTFTRRDVSDVAPQRGGIEIKVKAHGIYGSDVHGYLDITGKRTVSTITGHEFAGGIEALGTDIDGLKSGDRVFIYPIGLCGNCRMCKKGMAYLCLNRRAFGVLDVSGAFAKYIYVPTKCCFSLSNKVSYSAGPLLEPLAVTYRSVERVGELRGKTVLIVNAGIIGLLALVCVKMKGATKIIQSDLSDHHLKVARGMEANVAINPGSSGWKAEILAQTGGRGVGMAIEAAGVELTVQQAVSALGFASRAIWIGNSRPMIAVNMQEIITRKLSVQGSFLYGYEELRTVVDPVNRGRIYVTPFISREVSMEGTPAYFEKLAKGPGNLIKVVMVDQE